MKAANKEVTVYISRFYVFMVVFLTILLCCGVEAAFGTEPPDLFLPANLSSIHALTVNLDWFDSPGFLTEYCVEISDSSGTYWWDGSFRHSVDSKTTRLTSWRTPALLTGTYYWHVGTIEGGPILGDIYWSEIRQFHIDSAPKGLPKNGTSVDGTPWLWWDNLSGAAKYRLEVATSPNDSYNGDFSPWNLVLADWTYGSYYTVSPLLPDGTYYWHVQGADSAGNVGSYSDVESFTVAKRGIPGYNASTFYFAEGYTGDGFQEWLCLQNSNDTPANVVIQYRYRGGGGTTQYLTIGPRTRETIDVNAVVGPNKEVSAMVASDELIVAERPMYFNFNGFSGGHNAIGAESPSTAWYFAEGYTGEGFQEWLTLQNPNSSPANVAIEYSYRGGGGTSQNVIIGADTRETIDVNSAVGTNKEVSVKVTANKPIVAERPMYFNFGGITGGHDVIGATSAATSCYFAEGFTGSGFQEWLTLQNPNASSATANITYMYRGGGTKTVAKVIPGNSRETIDVNADAGEHREVSVKVDSSQPIITERPMYFNFSGITGGHDVVGVAAGDTMWQFSEGYTGPGFDEWLCLQNPNSQPTDVSILYLCRSGRMETQSLWLGANSRETISVNDFLGDNEEVSAVVMSDADKPIIAERPMYFNFNSIDGGHNVVGFPLLGYLD